jgi:hypothetical protein
MLLEFGRRKLAPHHRWCASSRNSSIDRGGDLTVTKDQSKAEDDIGVDDICIDDLDFALNPIGRFYRHNAMHAGTTRMVLDEFGRCAKCVALGFWKPDA